MVGCPYDRSGRSFCQEDGQHLLPALLAGYVRRRVACGVGAQDVHAGVHQGLRRHVAGRLRRRRHVQGSHPVLVAAVQVGVVLVEQSDLVRGI